MPAYGPDVLSDDDIRELADYIRTELGGGRASAKGGEDHEDDD